MKLSEATIEPMLPSNVRDAAELLGQSLLRDPMSIALFGETPEKTCKRLAGVFRLMLGCLPGESMCIKDGKKIVAVMRMVKPGQCQPSGRQILQAMPQLLMTTGTTLPRVLTYLSFLEKFDPKKKHWHLGPFAVDPELQRKGLGTRLLEYFCNYVDHLNEAAYLETNKATNVRFYERHGFSTIHEEPLFDVPNWFMWRDPQKTL
jgi:ribosomal protein S18 acetylase RimI-like enzyme